MKGRIVIESNGKVSIFSEEGSFEAGAAKIKDLLAKLEAAGLQLSDVGQIESHRHDDIKQPNQQSHTH